MPWLLYKLGGGAPKLPDLSLAVLRGRLALQGHLDLMAQAAVDRAGASGPVHEEHDQKHHCAQSGTDENPWANSAKSKEGECPDANRGQLGVRHGRGLFESASYDHEHNSGAAKRGHQSSMVQDRVHLSWGRDAADHAVKSGDGVCAQTTRCAACHLLLEPPAECVDNPLTGE